MLREPWAIRRRNGGIDGNDALLDGAELLGTYGEWIPVVARVEVEKLTREWKAALQMAGRHRREVQRMRQAGKDLDGVIRRLADENERLRHALRQCQNTDDEYVYKLAGEALGDEQ
jgi:hypothetical protein